MGRTFAAIVAMLMMLSTKTESQGRYPLHIGDRWDYGYLEMGKFIFDHSESIAKDTVMPNGLTYAVRASGSVQSFLRQSGDSILSYLNGGERLEYNFGAKDGDTIAVWPGAGDTVSVSVSIGAGSVFGVTRTLWIFYTKWYHSTNENWATIADSVGKSYLISEGGYNEYLIGAIINGVTYGTITSLPPRSEARIDGYQLFQNYPNPFNPSTTIRYSLPHTAMVKLVVHDLLGSEVAVLVNGEQEAGNKEARFDASGLASGVYFYRLTAGEFTLSKKLIFLR